MQLVLTPELMIEAYKQGLFPMAYSAGSPYIHWVCPERRGQLSIPHLHIPRSLKRVVRQKKLQREAYHISIDRDFAGVLDGCAESTASRPETWINGAIKKAFMDLHARGHAHSIEVWQGDRLAGGLYGLAIGGAFFGESMFSRAPNASKAALVHLAARLWKGGFTILDTQFINPHLKQFGVYEIPYAEFRSLLRGAAEEPADFLLSGLDEEEIVKDYLVFRDSL